MSELVFNASRVVSIARIIVREFPALLALVAYNKNEESVAYQAAFKEYWGMTLPGHRILLVKAPNDFDAIRVSFGLSLYKGFDVVATFTHLKPHRFEVKQTNHPKFKYLSTIAQADVHAPKKDTHEQP